MLIFNILMQLNSYGLENKIYFIQDEKMFKLFPQVRLILYLLLTRNLINTCS